jgi:hypothetical protein
MITHAVAEVWVAEPDFENAILEPSSLDCRLYRNDFTKTWCGYVRLPPDHPDAGLLRAQADAHYDVHGGISYAGEAPLSHWDIFDGHWLGFDCAHAGDYQPGMVDMWNEIIAQEPEESARIEALFQGLYHAERDVYRTIAYARREVRRLAKQVHQRYRAAYN